MNKAQFIWALQDVLRSGPLDETIQECIGRIDAFLAEFPKHKDVWPSASGKNSPTVVDLDTLSGALGRELLLCGDAPQPVVVARLHTFIHRDIQVVQGARTTNITRKDGNYATPDYYL